jgi:2C-methyl-D-erythritol 2,4-cyclodiphosphate synthase
MPSVWLDVPDAHPAVPAICPNLSLTFDNRPITLHDSVLLHDSTAVAVAKGFVLPRDRALLIDKSDTDVVNDSLAFSIQGAVSTSDLARRLLVRNEEMKSLRNQTGVLQRLLKYYKQKHMELKQENTQLKKLVLSYADNLGPKIEEMENDTKRIHREYEKLQVDVHKYHTSLRPSSSQVLYLN